MRLAPKLLCVLSLLLASNAIAGRLKDNQIRHDLSLRADTAGMVFREIMDAPDQGIPQSLLNRASCVAVFPSVKKGGFAFGGQWGRGVVSCRQETQGWGPPVFVTIGGGSFGFQIGFQSVDLVLLIMNRSGINSLLSSKIEIGADAGATAGMVGRNAAISTDAFLGSRILSYSRSRGLFAGIELKGSMVKADNTANRVIYGERHLHEIFTSTRVRGATDVMAFPRALNEASIERLVDVKIPMAESVRRRRRIPSTNNY
jgi:SH3 domain-containing YSC84-like protein 1